MQVADASAGRLAICGLHWPQPGQLQPLGLLVTPLDLQCGCRLLLLSRWPPQQPRPKTPMSSVPLQPPFEL